MAYYTFEVTVELFEEDKTECGVVIAYSYKEAEQKVKRFYRKDKVKKTVIEFGSAQDVLIQHYKEE